MIDFNTTTRRSRIAGLQRRSLAERFKPAAILFLIFIAYGIVGRMDFEDEVARSQAQTQTAQPQVVLVASAAK